MALCELRIPLELPERLKLFDTLGDALAFTTGSWAAPLLEISNDQHTTSVELFRRPFQIPPTPTMKPVPDTDQIAAVLQLVQAWTGHQDPAEPEAILHQVIRDGIVRVLEAADRSLNVQEFVLTTTIEGVANLHDKLNTPAKDTELKHFKKKVSELVLETFGDTEVELAQKVSNHILAMQPRITRDRLTSLFANYGCRFPDHYWKAWRSLRVPMAHGLETSINQERIDALMVCYELWNVLVLAVARYSGRFIAYSQPGGFAYPPQRLADLHLAGEKHTAKPSCSGKREGAGIDM